MGTPRLQSPGVCPQGLWGVDYGLELAGPDGEWKKAYIVNVNGGAKTTKPWWTNGKGEGRDLEGCRDL